MNIKPFIAAAVIALTAACTEEPTVVDTPVTEEEAVDTAVKDTVEQAELDNGEVNPREVSEENPAFKPRN